MVKGNRILKIFESFILGKCRCGCNKDIFHRDRRGYFKRYYIYHHKDFKNENHPQWKGGQYPTERGYIMIKKPNYFSSNKRGYVFEHVYNYQENYKCCILKWGKIHHINKIPTDNRIKNLLLTNQSNHMKIYHNHKKDLSNRKCLICKSKTTYTNPKGIPYWHKYKNGFICEKCFKKLLL